MNLAVFIYRSASKRPGPLPVLRVRVGKSRRFRVADSGGRIR
jgi:hypothetical protein